MDTWTCRFCLSFFSLLVLAGCSASKDIRENPLESARFDEQQAIAYYAPETLKESPWWEMFRDLELIRLIQAALREPLDLSILEMRMQKARSLVSERPFLFAPNERSHAIRSSFIREAAGLPEIIDIDLSIHFSQEFQFWNKNRELLIAAIGETKSHELDVKQAKLLLSLALAKIYFDLQAHEAQEKIAGELQRERTAQYQLTQARQNSRKDSEIQRLQIAQRALEIEKIIPQIQKEMALDKELLLALNPNQKCEPLKPNLTNLLPLPHSIYSDLLPQRPDLMAQIWRLEAVSKQIGAAPSHFYPNISLTSATNYKSHSFKQLFAMDSAATHPAYSLPIFSAKRLTSGHGVKIAEFEEAVFAYNELLFRSAQDTADEIAIFFAVNEQIRLHSLSLEISRQNFTIKFFRYTQGSIDYLEVLQAEEELLKQRMAEISLHLAHLHSAINLARSVGGAW